MYDLFSMEWCGLIILCCLAPFVTKISIKPFISKDVTCESYQVVLPFHAVDNSMQSSRFVCLTAEEMFFRTLSNRDQIAKQNVPRHIGKGYQKCKQPDNETTIRDPNVRTELVPSFPITRTNPTNFIQCENVTRTKTQNTVPTLSWCALNSC